MSRPRMILLGPQRLQPTLREAVTTLCDGGRVAVVTAGWEERENEDGELVAHLACEVVNLRLHERAEDVFRRDRALYSAMLARYDRLRHLRDIYRMRLDHALEAARELMHHEGDDALVDEERREAIEAVRLLDEHHLTRTRHFQQGFEEEHAPEQREHIRRHRDELDRVLSGCAVICVAGGHVGILINRLRLFGLEPWLRRLPTVAWSAGAMALSERIVLFHDSPPWGRVNAEVMEAGLGVAPDVVPLPHAKRRLLLDDEQRVALFARRFGPGLCCALDEGSRLERTPEGWSGSPETRRLTDQGTLVEVGAWA